jgi:hypothetical protein
LDIKQKYKVLNFLINPETLNRFEIMEDRRIIREGHVGKIHGVLLNNQNPIGVLVVNERNGKWRIIDGNHRIEAIKRFYNLRKENQKKQIECTLRVYCNLTDEEERELYGKEATRINESHEDRLNIYKDTINFWKMTQDPLKEFPVKVSIYNTKRTLRLRTILDALCTVKQDMKNGYYPKYLTKSDLVTFAQELTYVDFLEIKNFLKIFVASLGDIDESNSFSRRIGFLPLFDIYVRNFRDKSDKEVIERFKRIMGKSDVMVYLNMQGREAQQTLRRLMLGYINSGYSKNLAI